MLLGHAWSGLRFMPGSNRPTYAPDRPHAFAVESAVVYGGPRSAGPVLSGAAQAGSADQRGLHMAPIELHTSCALLSFVNRAA
jgi:hypothetical protein